MKLNYSTLVIATIALIFVEARFCAPPWTPLRIAALIIAVLAFALLALARIQLGGSFSIQAKAQTLVTTGIYSRIRNPIYVFSTVFLAALVVFDRVPLLLLALLIVIPMQIARARNEQKVLADTFGPAYLDYKKQTWF